MAHILVVDDELGIRHLIARILESEGHRVDLAGSGQEALDAIDCWMPDLIVLDLVMPEMDGWRFLEELYKRGVRRRTRVLIVSGYVQEAPPPEGQPAHRILPKPFDAADLIGLVDRALSEEPEDLFVRSERTRNLAQLISRVDEILG